MAQAAEPPFQELLWTIAVARLLFGPSMNIQAPPNLTSGGCSVQRHHPASAPSMHAGVHPLACSTAALCC